MCIKEANEELKALTRITTPGWSYVTSRTKENDGLQLSCRHGGVYVDVL